MADRRTHRPVMIMVGHAEAVEVRRKDAGLRCMKVVLLQINSQEPMPRRRSRDAEAPVPPRSGPARSLLTPEPEYARPEILVAGAPGVAADASRLADRSVS